ncbi:hypothetical protein DL770_004148 [Monosporascus sp. CRB-9-2]|nr:hypothetical protein DL770_004148 [Monosporascus sp. CRB-9-2]
MPWRGPFARPLHFRVRAPRAPAQAQPARGRSGADVVSGQTATVPTTDVATAAVAAANDRGYDDVGSLRDEERAAARDYVVARLGKLRWAKLDPAMAAQPLPPNPFPGLEARRPGRPPLSSDAPPRVGISGRDGDETEEDADDDGDEDGDGEAHAVGNGDGGRGEDEAVDQTEESENYLLLLNRGIAAAVIEGQLPQWYINEVLRPWVLYPKERLI